MATPISNTDIFILKLKSSKHLKSNFILLYDLFYDEGVKVITPFELFKLNNFYSRVQYYQQILVLFLAEWPQRFDLDHLLPETLIINIHDWFVIGYLINES